MSDVFCALRVPERMEYSSLSCGLIPRVHAGEKERNERETSVGKEYWFTRSRLVSLSLSLCVVSFSLSLFSRVHARAFLSTAKWRSLKTSRTEAFRIAGKSRKERKQKQTEQKIKRKRERDVREKKRERREKQKRARRPKKRERARERLLCFRARDVHERTRCALPLLQHVLRFTILFSTHATHDACT